ncbi:hypothetical protein D9M71_362760 [compost metagenome]
MATFCACNCCRNCANGSCGAGLAVTGKVLMNRPTCCSMPLSAAGRPATVAPNVTLSCPV